MKTTAVVARSPLFLCIKPDAEAVLDAVGDGA
jgi:hypothetical protein